MEWGSSTFIIHRSSLLKSGCAMFVLIGFGNEARHDHGPAISILCPNCHNQTYLRLIEIKKRFSLFFIPLFPYDWTYALVCDVCSRGVELDEEQFEKAKRVCRANRLFRQKRISEEKYNRVVHRSRLLEYTTRGQTPRHKDE